MARIKYYDAVSASWKYADAAFSNSLVAGDDIVIKNNVISTVLSEKTKEELAEFVIASIPSTEGVEY